ncbi:MAG: hypothetical protein EP344_18325 [Bacteroidetes bacterium]|nr:MAG: hypothetical protein EP344_18325 [Bacteroidota bacterium]
MLRKTFNSALRTAGATLVLILMGGSLFAQQYDPPNNDDEFERQYQERIKKDRLHGIYIPKNLDDALAQLDKLSSAESKQTFMAIPEDDVCKVMHNRLGQWMIVNWGFYEGSRLSHYLRSAGVTYPDDMADFLILAFHRHLHQKPISIRELAVYFREHRKTAWEQEKKEGEVLKEIIRKHDPDTTDHGAPADTQPAPAQGKSPKSGPEKSSHGGE